MRQSQDSDYELSGNLQTQVLRQFYAAVILRVLIDISEEIGFKDAKKPKLRRRKYSFERLPYLISPYASAMMWVFNEHDCNKGAPLTLSMCCDALDLEEDTIKRLVAKIIINNKKTATRDKTSDGENFKTSFMKLISSIRS